MNRIFLLIFCISFLLLGGGCSSFPNTAGRTQKDTQRYARIEVYTPDHTLVNAIEDEDTLAQFNETAVLSDELSEEETDDDQYLSTQEILKEKVKNAASQYSILSYKSPAALISDGELILISEITVYEDSNIIKEQVSSDAVPALKILDLSEDLMTFYYETDEEQISFLRSLADGTTDHN